MRWLGAGSNPTLDRQSAGGTLAEQTLSPAKDIPKCLQLRYTRLPGPVGRAGLALPMRFLRWQACSSQAGASRHRVAPHAVRSVFDRQGTVNFGFGQSIALAGRQVHADDSTFVDVDLSVNNAAVLMTGKVKTPEEKVLATKLAWEIRGVREVVSELQGHRQILDQDVAKDLAASAQLRGRLIADSDISSLNFSVDVVNNRLSVGHCRRCRG